MKRAWIKNCFDISVPTVEEKFFHENFYKIDPVRIGNFFPTPFDCDQTLLDFFFKTDPNRIAKR